MVGYDSSEGRSQKEVWCPSILDVLEGKCKWEEEQNP